MLGAGHIFEDSYLDCEDNARVMDFLFRWLARQARERPHLRERITCEPTITRRKCLWL